MPIEFKCQQCNKVLRVPDTAAGQQAKCPSCSAVQTVPDAASNEPVSPPVPTANPFGMPASSGDSPFAPETGNPYQSPTAMVFTETSNWPGGIRELASPWVRLGAAIIDSFLQFLGALPGLALLFASVVMQSPNNEPNVPLLVAGFAVAFIGSLAVAIYQWVLITNTGQSLAKGWLGIRIVTHPEAQLPGFLKGVVLRAWVPGLIGSVPYVGGCFSLIDVLFIFGEERRCLHDQIAGTCVIVAQSSPNA